MSPQDWIGPSTPAERWDGRWYRIYDDAVMDGADHEIARARADAETVEQFGPRPEESA